MKKFLFALLLPTAVAAQAQTNPLTISNPSIKGQIATATITTPTDDRLEGLSAQGGIAMLHGIVRHHMVRLAIPFKANKPRRLSSHGYHIMLMHKLPVGSALPITLIFEKAGAVNVTFKVM